VSTLRVLGRILAVCVVVSYALITPALVYGLAALEVALHPDLISRLADAPGLAGAIIDSSAQELADGLRYSNDSRYAPLARLSEADWRQIMSILAPPESLRQWSRDMAINLRSDLVRGRRPADVVIPLGAMRRNMAGGAPQIVRIIVEAQPPCTAGASPLAGSADLLPRCKPEEADALVADLSARWQADSVGAWDALWRGEMRSYSTDISLADLTERESSDPAEARQGWVAAGLVFTTGRVASYAVLLVGGLIALAAIALLATRNLPEVMRWTGAPVALAGGFTVVLAGLTFAALTVGQVGWHAGQTWTAWDTVGRHMAETYAAALWPVVAVAGGVLCLIGLTVWGVSFAVGGAKE